MDDTARLRLVLGAISDPARLALLGTIAGRHPAGIPLDELCAQSGGAPSKLWPHLNALKRAGLILIADGGTDPTFSIDTDSLEDLAVYAATLAPPAQAPPDGISEEEHRVLATFVKDGRIDSFPAQLKKQLVLWRYLVRRFEVDRAYPEAEVNDLLRAIHPDVATVRRALVDNGLMTRDAGVYRRSDAPPST